MSKGRIPERTRREGVDSANEQKGGTVNIYICICKPIDIEI